MMSASQTELERGFIEGNLKALYQPNEVIIQLFLLLLVSYYENVHSSPCRADNRG